MFFSGSKHTYPGKGASECLSEADEAAGSFDALFAIDDFRRKLSNFHPLPGGLMCAGRHWLTVEHCFQGRKFMSIDEAYAGLFSLESGSELSQADGAAARKAGSKKAKPLSEEERKAWDARKKEVMREALLAKFSQFPEMRALLLATKDAELYHRPPRSRLVREDTLMEVREALREG